MTKIYTQNAAYRKSLPAIFVILSVGLASACDLISEKSNINFNKPVTDSSQPTGESRPKAVEVLTRDGRAEGQISAGASTAQLLNTPSSSSVAGTSVLFPAGSLAIDTTVSVAEASTLTGGNLSELGVSERIVTSGRATEIASSANIDAVRPFSIVLPLPSDTALNLINQEQYFAVLYRVKVAGESEERAGIAGADAFRFYPERKVIEYDTYHFGTFQVITTKQKVVASKQLLASKVFGEKTTVASPSPTPSNSVSPPSSVADTTPPQIGTLSISNVTSSGFRVDWTEGSDNITAASGLRYLACYSDAATKIDTIAKCESMASLIWQAQRYVDISSLSPNITRVIGVVVKDAAENKAFYGTINGTTAADTSAPTAGTFTASTGISVTGYTLNWSAAIDDHSAASALEYYLCSGPDAASIDSISKCEASTREMNWTTAVTSRSFSGKQTATVYYHNLIVRDAAGNKSLYDGKSQATATDNLPPTAGTFAGSTGVNLTEFTLNWSAANDNVTPPANLEYYLCSGASSSAIDTVAECEAATQEMNWTAATLTRDISGKQPSTTYYYNVVVRDAAGNKSLYDGKSEATLPDSTAPVPGSFSGSTGVTETGFTLNWTAATDNHTGGSGLEYFLCSGASIAAIDTVAECEAATKAMDWTVASLFRNISGKQPLTNYYFNVLVRDSAGNKAPYAGISQSTNADNTAPSTGTITVTSGTSTSLAFSWSAATDNFTPASSLEYLLCGDGDITAIDTIAECDSLGLAGAGIYGTNLLNRSHGGLSAGATYHYSVVVRDAAGNQSLYPIISQVTPTDAPQTTQVSQIPVPVKRSFYDSIHGNHWTLTQNGTNIRISRAHQSASNVWWRTDDLALNTRDFSIATKTIGGTTYVYVAATVGLDVIVRRGTVGASAITFENPVTVFDGSSTNDRYTKPAIAVTDAYVWVAASQKQGLMWSAVVRNSIYPPQSDLTNWQSAEFVGKSSSVGRDLILMPRYSNELSLVVHEGTTLRLFLYDGTAWSEANNGSGSLVSTPFATAAGLPSDVRALAVCDGVLYVGGVTALNYAGGHADIKGAAFWDGTTWRSMNGASFTTVSVIKCGPDGVYFGGSFTGVNGMSIGNHIVRWDGNSFRPVGNQSFDGMVTDIEVVGSEVYVSGLFANPVHRVAKWNGVAWSSAGITSSVGSGFNALTSFNGVLYAGGGFTSINGQGCSYLAKYQSGSWTCMNNGIVASTVNVLSASPSGVLYSDGGSGNSLRKWDGSTWVTIPGQPTAQVKAIEFSNSDLYLTTTDAGAAIVKYNGTSWEFLGNQNIVYALAFYDGDLIAGGGFVQMGGVPGANKIARYNGTSWNIFSGVATGAIYAIKRINNKLYLGGAFLNFAGINGANNIVAYDLDIRSWQSLGTGTTGQVYALEAIGSKLYIGGNFTDANGDTSFARLVAFDTDTSTFFAAPSGGPTSGSVYALKAAGSGLYLGGNDSDSSKRVMFSTSGTSAWVSEGSPNNAVFALEHDGTNLYIGGSFTSIGASPINRVAKKTSGNWYALGSGVTNTAYALFVDGTSLYVGGQFTEKVMKWNGAWTSMSNGAPALAKSLVFANGSLYAAFDHADGMRRWNGSTWELVTKPMGGNGVTLYQDASLGLLASAGNSLNVIHNAGAGNGVRSFDAVVTDSNQILIAYALGDMNGGTADVVATKRYDGSNWSGQIVIGSYAVGAVPSYPSLVASNSANKQWLTWGYAGAINFSEYNPPFWSAPTDLQPATANLRKGGCDMTVHLEQFKCFGHQGTGTPYKTTVSYITP